MTFVQTHSLNAKESITKPRSADGGDFFLFFYWVCVWEWTSYSPYLLMLLFTNKGNWLKEINPEYSLEGLMLKLKLQFFGHMMHRAGSLEKTLMLGKI